jgi:hypothetical protein
MRKLLGLADTVSTVPYLIAFGVVTVLAFVIGKIPSRRNKLLLLPWLDGLCACLTLLVAFELVRLAGLHDLASFCIGSAAWAFFYLRRSRPFIELCRAGGGFLAGLGLDRLS